MLKQVPDHIPIDTRKVGLKIDPRWKFFRDQGQQIFDSRDIIYLNLNKNSTNYYYRKTGDTTEPLGKFTKIVMPPNQTQILEYYIEFDGIYDSNNKPIKVNPADELYYTDTEIDVNEDFVKTIPPNEKYTWTEMNEMVERKIRDVVGKMTDAIKEEIVGSYSEEHANYRSLHDSHYNKEKHHPLTPDEYAQLWFSAISVFNVYLIKVLHKIVDDYKYIHDYKKYSTSIRDILDIALKNEDAFATENFPKGSSNSGTQHNMVPGDYMYAFMNVSLDKIPEYKDLMDPNNSLWAHTHVFLRNAFQTFLSLLGMMIERNIFPYNNDFASKELIVHPTHWGLLAHHGMTSNIFIKNPLINHNTNKTNQPFLMRFLTIFRDFYSFLIDEIDYDVSLVKKGGKSRKRRIQKNKKTRNHKK